MSSFIRRAIACAFIAFCGNAAFAVDYGRTPGSFSVSHSGAATYSIPIWTPPGPNGVQPSLSLSYSSQGGNGLAGVGWNLNAASAIERCPRTKHQDGTEGGIELSVNDRFCIDGKRLRLDSGAYGVVGSVYFTEIADYSRITYTSVGGNPAYFIVESKSGLKYEYGNSTSSRVFPGIAPTISTTPQRWMLNKAFDRDGNNYVITYTSVNASGFAIPDVISWTPTYLGSSTYRYEAKFNYSTRQSWDSYYGRVAGFDVENRNRLESIQIKSSGVVKRKYKFAYDAGPVTGRSRLISAKECADDAESNCFLPIAFTYQNGLGGVAPGAITAPAGSSNGLKIGRYDFNGDGKDDLLYQNGSSWYAAFGANSGFAGPYATGVTGNVLVDRFLPSGRDGIAAIVSGNLWVYRWDDASSAFVGSNTGVASTMPSIAADFDGNGLADLVYVASGNATINFRRNNSTGSGNPSFETTTTSSTLSGYTWGQVFSYYGNGLQRADVNGDGRQDAYAVVLQPIYNGWGQQVGAQPYAAGLLGSTTGMTLQPSGTWVAGGNPVWPSLRFNDDACTDRQIGNNIHLAQCNGIAATTIAIPATPLLLLDWDGDGKTDVLVNNGGTFGVYKSTGTGFSSLVTTTISSTGTYYALDQDGDRMEDLVMLNGSGAISYWTHTTSGSVPSYATNVPELLSTVTDGFGVSYAPNYSTTSSIYYDKGTATNYPLQEARPRTIVANVTSSNGIGGTYIKMYFYVGARENAERGDEFAGFQRVDETDSRNGLITRTYYDQSFPVTGMINKTELIQPNGYITISRAVITNTSTQLSSTTGQERYFAYSSGSIFTKYEVNSVWDGALLRTVTTANTFETVGGTLYDQTITTTEPASGANGVTAGGSWVARTYLPSADLINNTANWCLGRPQQVQQINSSNRTYGTSLTRTKHIAWDVSKCRPTQTIDEPGNPTLQVTTGLGYDSFGNVNSTTVTGIGVSGGARTASTVYSDATFTTGQFPLSATRSESTSFNQSSSTAWDYDLGVPTSATDPNGITTYWLYDAFGRRNRENRPDGTYSTWAVGSCSGCDSRVRTLVTGNSYTNANSLVFTELGFLDQFDRSIYEYRPRVDNYSNVTTREFDALGRVYREYFPYPNSGSPVGYTTFVYDLLNRPMGVMRPISDSISTLQTTSILYEGLTTRVVDPQGKQSIRVVNAAGEVARSQDHDGYYQAFDYDAFGNPKRVSDSSSVLQSSTYNIRGMLTARTDMDMGAWSFTPNALGEVVSQTDAKGQTTTFTFDHLGRLTGRSEGGGPSTWIWGTSSASKNIGRLYYAASPDYSETYSYDAIGRPSITYVSADNTYQIDYSYNSIGALDTLTYPTSTSSYRLKVQYDYQNGHLYRVRDFNTPNTTFWTGYNATARNQFTLEVMANTLVTQSSFDAVTGLPKALRSGLGGGTERQNFEYEWDLVGNLTKRKEVNLSLTETSYYDNLYRLDYSQLNGVTNLDVAYDALGNISSKSDVGTYTNHATKKHQVVSTSNGWTFGYDSNGNMGSGRGAAFTWTSFNYPASITNGSDSSSFSYTPNRQYWRQISNYTSGGTATTIYIGGILEKVTTASGTDYRHMIRTGGSTTIVMSRQTSGTNSVRYLSSDHLGSSTMVTDSSGGVILQSSFDAFGKRRNGLTWSGNPSASEWSAIAALTRRGYTDHSMLDNLGLIHMNGRVQDPALGRFVSADPYITEPQDTQNYNRYSYVSNNPLSTIDPSGFEATAVMRLIVIPLTPSRPPCWASIGPACQPSVLPEADYAGPSSETTTSPKKDSDATWSPLQEDHECTIADFASDLWNFFKKEALFDNPLQIDFSAEVIWGWNDFDRMAINLGVNTLGQVVLTGEDARNMQGSGAIAAGSFGWNGGFSDEPAASGAYNVYHREIAGAAGHRGFSFATTTSPSSGSATAPHPPSGGGRGRIGGAIKGFRSLGLGLASFEGNQIQYISASDPLFDAPKFSGNCP